MEYDKSVLQEAESLVTGNRNAYYDHPLDNFIRIAKIWSAILDMDVSWRQVALCMDGVKLAREAYRPKRDNRVDGPGYWFALDIADQEEGRRMANDIEAIQQLLKDITTTEDAENN